MKYFKHVITEDGVQRVRSFNPEGTSTFIPEAPDNMDYVRMMEEVEAGTSTIEEIDDTPE
jgi:hypothetical protein